MNDIAETGRDGTTRTQLDRLLALAAEQEPIRMAVVHSCDEASLGGALEAFRMKLIVPVLVGPAAAAAAAAGEDLTGIRIVAVEHSHAAAEEAAAWRLRAKSTPS